MSVWRRCPGGMSLGLALAMRSVANPFRLFRPGNEPFAHNWTSAPSRSLLLFFLPRGRFATDGNQQPRSRSSRSGFTSSMSDPQHWRKLVEEAARLYPVFAASTSKSVNAGSPTTWVKLAVCGETFTDFEAFLANADPDAARARNPHAQSVQSVCKHWRPITLMATSRFQEAKQAPENEPRWRGAGPFKVYFSVDQAEKVERMIEEIADQGPPSYSGAAAAGRPRPTESFAWKPRLVSIHNGAAVGSPSGGLRKSGVYAFPQPPDATGPGPTYARNSDIAPRPTSHAQGPVHFHQGSWRDPLQEGLLAWQPPAPAPKPAFPRNQPDISLVDAAALNLSPVQLGKLRPEQVRAIKAARRRGDDEKERRRIGQRIAAQRKVASAIEEAKARGDQHEARALMQEWEKAEREREETFVRKGRKEAEAKANKAAQEAEARAAREQRDRDEAQKKVDERKRMEERIRQEVQEEQEERNRQVRWMQAQRDGRVSLFVRVSFRSDLLTSCRLQRPGPENTFRPGGPSGPRDCDCDQPGPSSRRQSGSGRRRRTEDRGYSDESEFDDCSSDDSRGRGSRHQNGKGRRRSGRRREGDYAYSGDEDRCHHRSCRGSGRDRDRRDRGSRDDRRARTYSHVEDRHTRRPPPRRQTEARTGRRARDRSASEDGGCCGGRCEDDGRRR